MPRPKLDNNDETLRVGFTVTAELWKKFKAIAKKRGIKASVLFREILEKL